MGLASFSCPIDGSCLSGGWFLRNLGSGWGKELGETVGGEVGGAGVLAAAEAEGDFEVGAGELGLDLGCAFGFDDEEVVVPLRGVLVAFEIADAGEVAEDPGEGVVAVEEDGTFELVAVGVRFGGGEEGAGEEVDVLVGLDIDIRFAVVGELEKIEADGGVEGGGEEGEGEQPDEAACGFCDHFLEEGSEEEVEGPGDGDKAPGGFVGDDGVGEESAGGGDGDEALAGVAGKGEAETRQDAGEGGPFVTGHEGEPVEIEGADEVVGGFFVSAGLDAGLEPDGVGFPESADGLEV